MALNVSSPAPSVLYFLYGYAWATAHINGHGYIIFVFIIHYLTFPMLKKNIRNFKVRGIVELHCKKLLPSKRKALRSIPSTAIKERMDVKLDLGQEVPRR